MIYEEDKEYATLLRHMLSELLEKQSGIGYTETDRTKFRKGSKAIKRALELMDTQIYA